MVIDVLLDYGLRYREEYMLYYPCQSVCATCAQTYVYCAAVFVCREPPPPLGGGAAKRYPHPVEEGAPE